MRRQLTAKALTAEVWRTLEKEFPGLAAELKQHREQRLNAPLQRLKDIGLKEDDGRFLLETLAQAGIETRLSTGAAPQANPAAAYVGDLRRRTEKSISGHKRDWLERVVGQRLAAEVLDEAEQSSKELEGRGVHFKGRPAAHPVEQYIDQVRKGGEE